MLFTQPLFIVFFIAVLLLHWQLLRTNTARKLMLVAASYVFYAAWDPRFLALIVLSTLVDYVAALRIAGSDRPGRRRAWLVTSLSVNLGMLGVFKYFNFFADSLQSLLGGLGIPVSEVTLMITLPVGISFFTFQTMSYTIDVYRGTLEPRRSLLDIALFVAFFPQLVAGPIVRAANFLPQLDAPRRLADVPWRAATILFAIGFFKKAVLADTFAIQVDRLFADPGAYDALSTTAGVLAYAAQIYLDFSGYTDMAIAVAMMLGYTLPKNFNFPYFAGSIDQFWRRWHISLSSWLRDYLYIPLGGNRGGRLLTYRNLMLTMLLGGLWHGAAWTFVAWGALHGVALSINKGWRDLRTAQGHAPSESIWVRALATLATFWFVCCAWIFFRAESFGAAWTLLVNFVTFSGGGAERLDTPIFAYLLVAGVLHTLAFTGALQRTLDRLSAPQLAVVLGLSAALMLALLPLGSRPFIYFQF